MSRPKIINRITNSDELLDDKISILQEELGTLESKVDVESVSGAIAEAISKIDISGDTTLNVFKSTDNWNQFVADSQTNTFTIEGYNNKTQTINMYYESTLLIPNKHYMINNNGEITLGFQLQVGEVIDYCINNISYDYNDLINKPNLDVLNDKIELSDGVTLKQEYENYLRRNKKEFASDNGKIVTSYGLNGRLFDAKMEGWTKIFKAPKGTNEWVEINQNEDRDIETYDYKLESVKANLSINGETYSFYASEEDKAQGKSIEIHGVNTNGYNSKAPRDCIEWLENGECSYTQNIVRTKINGTEDFKKSGTSKNGTHIIYDLIVEHSICNFNANSLVDKYKYKIFQQGYYEKPDETYVTNTAIANIIAISLPIEIAPTVEDAKKYLQETGGFEICREIYKPIETKLQTNLPSKITTHESDTFSVESNVKGNLYVTVPTSDEVAKSYNVTLLNGYKENSKSILELTKSGTIRFQIDVTSSDTIRHYSIFVLPEELRPITEKRFLSFINTSNTQILTVKTSGYVDLLLAPANNTKVFVTAEFKKED